MYSVNKKIKTNRIINPILTDIVLMKDNNSTSNSRTNEGLWDTAIIQKKPKNLPNAYIKEELNIDWDENDNVDELQVGIARDCPEILQNAVDLGQLRCNYCDKQSKRVYGKRIIKCEKCQVALEFVCQKCFRKKKIRTCEHNVPI